MEVDRQKERAREREPEFRKQSEMEVLGGKEEEVEGEVETVVESTGGHHKQGGRSTKWLCIHKSQLLFCR